MKKSRETSLGTRRWFSNIAFNIKSSRQWDKNLFYCQILPVMPRVLATYLGIMLPAEIVRALENHWDLPALMLYIFVLSLGICLMKMISEGMSEYLWDNAKSLTMYYEKLVYHKLMHLDYDMLEDSRYASLIGNVLNVIRNSYGIRDSLLAIPFAFTGLLSVLWYGAMIGSKNILIVIIAIINSLLSMKILAWAREKHRISHERLNVYSRQTAYINKQAMDRSAGKDIRIYKMSGWIMGKYEQAFKGIDDTLRQIRNGYFINVTSDASMTFILNLFSYVFLISLLVKKEITVSTFVLYIGLIKSFSSNFMSLMDQIVTLDPIAVSINYIRELLDLPENAGWSEGVGNEVIQRIKKEGIKVELRGVSFRYPGNKEDTLHHIDLTISPEEKLALIGLNGAGKTTMVKLLCGFYRPTEGKILINGIPVSVFSKEEYHGLVSVLFQDHTFLPVTLDLNLTGEKPEDIDSQKLAWALKMSGFSEKYESLPKKGETLLVREANGEATDFSGGEKQKLLFARALYKDSPFMILDEPTAALDPIAENQMYLDFSQAAKGKTCVYISHRLSSTRFCDRIILMEHGKITQEGTHDKLMAQGGRYAELFEVQSMYYKEQEKNKRQCAIMDDDFDKTQDHKGIFYE